jgi:hypothetical protein
MAAAVAVACGVDASSGWIEWAALAPPADSRGEDPTSPNRHSRAADPRGNHAQTAITTRILGLVHELCNKRIHVTKRDLFYTDVKLFEVC